MLNYFLFLIGGLIIGSFLNVIICRIPDINSIISTRSHCVKCKTKLAWYDLIPLFSYILLAQKCRYCGKQISWQYPLVELGTGLLFVLIYFYFGLSLVTCYLSLVTCFMMVIFVYDMYHQEILDEVIYPIIVISTVYLLFNSSIDFTNKLIGAGFGLGFILAIFLITKGKGIGFADIKLALLIGLILGWPLAVCSIFLAFIIGAIIGIYLIKFGGKTWKSAVAFGPFLIIGFYITLFWGQKIIDWYLGT